MTIVDRTEPSQHATLSFEFELQHAPTKVWRALTDPELLAEWLLPVVDQKLKLARGESFVLKTQPRPPWDGTVHCQVLEVDAPNKISYAWVVGTMAIDTVVTFTLTPTATGTRLSLVHSGFKPDQKGASGGQRYGWNLNGGRLADLLGRIA
jgi:uncharacterized protein YndB with AHSA1/START domain